MVTKIIDIQGEDLKNYQKEVLKIAKDLASFCDRKNIFYSLSGGSVLGAVRHGGFIPWDDDIDINMTRESYDSFIASFEKEYGDKYYVQTPVRNPELGLLVTQIRRKGTVARRKYDIDNQECGISIDIYIIENIFSNKLAFDFQKFGALFFPFLVSLNRSYKNRAISQDFEKQENRKIKYKKARKVLGKIASIIPVKFCIKESFYFFKMCKDSKSEFVSLPTGRRHINGEIFKRDEICESVLFKFEDTSFRIPADYETYLTKLYGDYMTVPNKSTRERHLFLELKY